MIVVVGMARSGISAARLLRSRGLPVFISDSGAPDPPRELETLGVGWETGGHTMERFLAAEEIVVSPGVPLDIPPLTAARNKGVPIVSELEVACRYLQGKIVAITGSNGKTTTTTLVGEIFRAAGRRVQVGGNIGSAMSGFVETSTPETINVIEVSSFQLDGIRQFRPHTGALLNVTPDHLDRYADFHAYRASKFRMFENQQEGDTAVLNCDDKQVYPPPTALRARQRLFSRRETVAGGAFLSGSMLYREGEAVMPVSDVRLRGSHNVENVLAAMAATADYGVDAGTLASAIAGFRGVEHRIEFVAAIKGVEFFNDSKATNVDSAVKAVESFAGKLILILGGKDKGASYAPLIEAMRGRVKQVVLVGAAADKIASAIGTEFPVVRASSMADAVRQGSSLGLAGDVVLLSPACASFDMFDNYEHRGRVFKEAVLELNR